VGARRPGPDARPGLSVAALIAAALAEDLGRGGDVTSALLVPRDLEAKGSVVARAEGVVAGRAAGDEVIHQTGLRARWEVEEGERAVVERLDGGGHEGATGVAQHG